MDGRLKHSTAQTTHRGFTLIEVVLVLAIGGLIFLLAFIAFSQVQRNRRNRQYKTDASRIAAELQNYLAETGTYPNNSVNLSSNTLCSDPATAPSFHDFLKTYMCKDNQFDSPRGTTYRTSTPGATPSVDRIRFQKNVACDGSSAQYKVEIVTPDLAIMCQDIT